MLITTPNWAFEDWTDNGLGDRGGEKSVIPALQLTHSGTGVKETQTLKCCGKNLKMFEISKVLTKEFSIEWKS